MGKSTHRLPNISRMASHSLTLFVRPQSYGCDYCSLPDANGVLTDWQLSVWTEEAP